MGMAAGARGQPELQEAPGTTIRPAVIADRLQGFYVCCGARDNQVGAGWHKALDLYMQF